MKHTNIRALCGLIIGLMMLSACTVLKMPQSYNERLASAYVTVTTIRQTAVILLDGHVISSKDAENIQAQADTAREGLDIARDLRGAAGEDKLEASLTVLRALERYVASKQKELSK